jgi:hypothetical protein
VLHTDNVVQAKLDAVVPLPYPLGLSITGSEFAYLSSGAKPHLSAQMYSQKKFNFNYSPVPPAAKMFSYADDQEPTDPADLFAVCLCDGGYYGWFTSGVIRGLNARHSMFSEQTWVCTEGVKSSASKQFGVLLADDYPGVWVQWNPESDLDMVVVTAADRMSAKFTAFSSKSAAFPTTKFPPWDQQAWVNLPKKDQYKRRYLKVAIKSHGLLEELILSELNCQPDFYAPDTFACLQAYGEKGLPKTLAAMAFNLAYNVPTGARPVRQCAHVTSYQEHSDFPPDFGAMDMSPDVLQAPVPAIQFDQDTVLDHLIEPFFPATERDCLPVAVAIAAFLTTGTRHPNAASASNITDGDFATVFKRLTNQTHVLKRVKVDCTMRPIEFYMAYIEQLQSGAIVVAINGQHASTIVNINGLILFYDHRNIDPSTGHFAPIAYSPAIIERLGLAVFCTLYEVKQKK